MEGSLRGGSFCSEADMIYNRAVLWIDGLAAAIAIVLLLIWLLARWVRHKD